jgi:hypothetical protein
MSFVKRFLPLALKYAPVTGSVPELATFIFLVGGSGYKWRASQGKFVKKADFDNTVAVLERQLRESEARREADLRRFEAFENAGRIDAKSPIISRVRRMRDAAFGRSAEK